MNIICINHTGVVFAEAIDYKAKTKSGEFIAGILRPIIVRCTRACLRSPKLHVKGWVMDGAWWKKAEFFVQLMELPYMLIRRTASAAKGMMRVIYDIMLQLTEELDTLLEGTDCRLSKVDKEGVQEH
ncbi:unnamed protein product [Closterium sp. NIES-64]|nr:unnamed protein product [Closterium sp. NIES-64]